MNRNNIDSIPFNPFAWVVTGFIQSDGYFGISFINVDYGSGLNIRFYLRIELHTDSLLLLKKVQSYFGCGRLNLRKDRKICSYEITSIYELWHILIPHFLNYPLFGVKQISFIRFVQALSLMYPFVGKKNRKSTLLLGKVLFLMTIFNPINNRSTSEIEKFQNKLKFDTKNKEEIIKNININFNNCNYLIYSYYLSQTSLFNINTFFILGFIEGDGSFYFNKKNF